jgi:glutamate racemase
MPITRNLFLENLVNERLFAKSLVYNKCTKFNALKDTFAMYFIWNSPNYNSCKEHINNTQRLITKTADLKETGGSINLDLPCSSTATSSSSVFSDVAMLNLYDKQT